MHLENINKGSNISQNSEKILKILSHKKFQERFDRNFLLMLFKTHKYSQGIISLSDLMQNRQELLTIYMENHNNDKIISTCVNYAGNDSSYWIRALNYFLNSTLESKNDFINQILDRITESDLISPILILEILQSKDIPFELVRKHILKILTKGYKEINTNKSDFEKHDDKIKKFENELLELKTKASQFSIGKCNICNQPTNINVIPVVFFLCHHSFHLYCLNAEMHDDNLNNEPRCPTCSQRSNHVMSRIKQTEENNENYNEFNIELGNTVKKMDYIAKFMGMGLFKLSKIGEIN